MENIYSNLSITFYYISLEYLDTTAAIIPYIQYIHGPNSSLGL